MDRSREKQEDGLRKVNVTETQININKAYETLVPSDCRGSGRVTDRRVVMVHQSILT